MIKRPKIKFYADPRRQPEGIVAIHVEVNYGERVYIPTDHKYTIGQWEIIQDLNKRNSKQHGLTEAKLIEIRNDLNEFLKRINLIVDTKILEGKYFTAQSIKNEFYTFKPNSISQLSLINLFNELIQQKKEIGKKYKTIESYENARKSFEIYIPYIEEQNKGRILSEAEKYKSIKNFNIINVDNKFLSEWENYMKNTIKKKDGTITSYLINLRAVFNYSISKGIISEKTYPFKKSNQANYHKIRTVRKTKKALFEDDLKKILDVYDKLTVPQKRAVDYFIFSYLCNGANMIDIAQFKNENFDWDSNLLKFKRRKTEGNVDVLEDIVIQLEDIHFDYIERIKSKNKNSKFIFDILDGLENIDENSIRERVSSQLHSFKERYKIVSRIANINTFTFTSARHSFAANAIINGVNKEIVGNGLGHSNTETTEWYLGSITKLEPTDLTKSKLKIFNTK